jgi:cytochrome c553
MRSVSFAILLATGLFLPNAIIAGADIPVWAYGTDPALVSPGGKTPPDQTPRQIPGSNLQFVVKEIQDPFSPADWFPTDHPNMPEVVAHGRKPSVWACALCHYPNGKGRPENAGVSGLPVSYFVEQMHAFRDGTRTSADPRKKNTGLMATFAKTMTEAEIQSAAEYFGQMKWTPWIKVMETRTVPKTHTSVGMYLPIPGGGEEEIGRRIIEVPVDPEGTEVLRNPRSGFLAYVPVGSIQKGQELVSGRVERTTACGVCHGPDLRGLGPVPGIAGRSPSYTMRQLYDMQRGPRAGNWTELMRPVVQRLTDDDMLEIAAYVSSLAP